MGVPLHPQQFLVVQHGPERRFYLGIRNYPWQTENLLCGFSFSQYHLLLIGAQCLSYEMLWRSWEDLGFFQAWEHLQGHTKHVDGCFPFCGAPQKKEEGLKEQRCPWIHSAGDGDAASTGGTDPARSSWQGRSTKSPARGADPSSLPTAGFRVINTSDPMCWCWEGRPVPP